MAVKVYQYTLAAGAQSLAPAGGEAANIPFRQLLFTTTGAQATIGDATVTATKGMVLLTTAAQPLSIGPFPTGPVKLSDFYAVGAGATLTVTGIPF